MLAEPSFCFPIAAAQVQYRDRYYGLSAASLLEDLFFDALVYFTRQNEPAMEPTRPPRGEKGYDYAIDGERISHKVGKRATQIAVLWDATRTIERWDATDPIVYHSFDATGRRRTLTTTESSTTVQQVTGPNQRFPKDSVVLVAHWRPDGSAKRLGYFEIGTSDDLAAEANFRRLWALLKNEKSHPANEIEVLICPKASARKAKLETAQLTAISQETRPGLYFLDPDLLSGVTLTRNNRGQLIPASTVEAAMTKARSSSRFVPLPTWFSMYTQVTPPSLYLAQKAQFDELFST